MSLSLLHIFKATALKSLKIFTTVVICCRSRLLGYIDIRKFCSTFNKKIFLVHAHNFETGK